jgi:hypothetical protein
METITQLEPETIDDLRDLIRANLDSAKFFREAAANVASPGLVDLFESVGRIRAKHASELQAYLRRNEVDAEVGGTLLGTWHRWWLDLRAWANAGDPTAPHRGQPAQPGPPPPVRRDPRDPRADAPAARDLGQRTVIWAAAIASRAAHWRRREVRRNRRTHSMVASEKPILVWPRRSRIVSVWSPQRASSTVTVPSSSPGRLAL